MRKFRFLVCLFLALSLAPAASTAEKGFKRLYLPLCVCPDGANDQEAKTEKLPFYLSFPAKPLGIAWGDFVAQKDKTPAEKFAAEVLAAVADGTATAKYLAGNKGFWLSRSDSEGRQQFFATLRLEYLARFDGEYWLLCRIDAPGRSGYYPPFRFFQDQDGKWRVLAEDDWFGSLVPIMLAAAIRRGEQNALFTDPGLRYVAGVTHDRRKWEESVVTPDSEFKAHFNARPLNGRRFGGDDPLAPALRTFATANPQDSRYGTPLLAVDLGTLAWVIYVDAHSPYTAERPLTPSVFFRKTDDGAWGRYPGHDLEQSFMPCFDHMAITVLNAARPTVK